MRFLLIPILLLLCQPVDAAAPFQLVLDCRIQSGDQTRWSERDFDDRSWPERQWKDERFEDPIWLRCKVQIDSKWSQDAIPIGLFLTGTFSAEAWWDGEFLGRKGAVGIDAKQESPGRNNEVIYLAPRHLDVGEHLLALRMSAQHAGPRIDTPVDALYLATYQDPLAISRRQYRPAIWTAGALMLAAIFVFVMGIRAGDQASLWLGLATLATLTQLGLETSRGFINYTYDWHPVRLLGISLAAAVAGIGLVSYLCRRFNRPMIWVLPIVFSAALTVPTIPYPDLITVVINATTLTIASLVCLIAWRKGQRQALLALCALLAVALVLVSGPEEFLDTGQYLGFSFLLLVFFADHINAFINTRQEREQARTTAARLELELLKKHLRPHFLMNTLTSLSEWVETSPATGVKMIEALSNEFQCLDQIADRKLIALDSEIDLCRQHLAVMGYRQDLSFELTIDAQLPTLWLPPAILHTLIENALTHGDYRGDTTLNLEVRATENRIHMVLRAPSGHTPPRPETSEGTGLSYVRARMTEAFGMDWQMTCGATDEGGWSTEMTFPWIHENPDR